MHYTYYLILLQAYLLDCYKKISYLQCRAKNYKIDYILGLVKGWVVSSRSSLRKSKMKNLVTRIIVGHWKNLKIFIAYGKIPKFIKHMAFNKAVGPGKKSPKLINIGPTFIPDYRVIATTPSPCLTHILVLWKYRVKQKSQ